MKKITVLLIICVSAFVSGCEKKSGCTDATAINYDHDAEKDCGCCTYQGTVTFWKTNSVGNDVNVTIKGTTKVITTNFVNTPSCNTAGCASFTLNPGVYTFEAVEQGLGIGTWSSNIEIKSKTCLTLELK